MGLTVYRPYPRNLELFEDVITKAALSPQLFKDLVGLTGQQSSTK